MVTGIVLLIWGFALISFGFNTAQAPLGRAGEALSAGYSEETIVYLIAGGLSLLIGLFLMFKPNKSLNKTVNKSMK
jgi:uncharacterized membrane protein HdeD (DUF308 family)